MGVVCLDISNGDSKTGCNGEPHLELDGGRVDIEEHLVKRLDELKLAGRYPSMICKGRLKARLGCEKDMDWFGLITPMSNGVTLLRLVGVEHISDN